MNSINDKLIPNPQSDSAPGGWWHRLFAKKAEEKKSTCWSCYFIRGTGTSKPWDIDCRFCDKANQEGLANPGSMVDLDEALELVRDIPCYHFVFTYLGIVTREGRPESVHLKANYKSREIKCCFFQNGKSWKFVPPPFSYWSNITHALEGVLWFRKRPYIRVIKSGKIFQAKMNRWPKGYRETVSIDVVPEE